MEEAVKEYYGKTLKTKYDLQTNACKCSMGNFPKAHKNILLMIHDEIATKFYGCGSPIPFDIKGCTVVDLGCGTGRDVYLASALVGETGKVIGIDMTREQLATARKYIDYHREKFGYDKTNVEFIKGDIENIQVDNGSIDVVISNCVINLTNNKENVFAEIYRILKYGGELLFSDVFADRRIPQTLASDPILYGECLTGALYIEDFRRMVNKVGFLDYRVVSRSPIMIENQGIKDILGDIKFFSITIRTFKLPSIEDRCEDYGQSVTYQGSINENPEVFNLDECHSFPKNENVRVCGNTADMLSKTRYGKHFIVTERGQHQGLFDCLKNSNQCNPQSSCC